MIVAGSRVRIIARDDRRRPTACQTASASTVARDVVHAHDRARRAATAASAAATLRRPARSSTRSRPVSLRRASPCATSRRAPAQPSAEQLVAGARSSSRLCVERLAEAEARVDDDALARDARAPRSACARSRRKSRTSRDDVVVVSASAASCAARPACASGRRRTSRARRRPRARPARCSARDVVDHVGAGVERRAHHRGLASCRPRPGTPSSRAPSTTGSTRASSSASATGGAPGRRRLAADVEDVGALAQQRSRVRERRAGVEVAAAVGERVGRDVDDAHHERPREIEREAAGPPEIERRIMKNGAEAPSRIAVARDRPQAAARRAARRHRRHAAASA